MELITQSFIHPLFHGLYRVFLFIMMYKILHILYAFDSFNRPQQKVDFHVRNEFACFLNIDNHFSIRSADRAFPFCQALSPKFFDCSLYPVGDVPGGERAVSSRPLYICTKGVYSPRPYNFSVRRTQGISLFSLIYSE